MATKGSSFTYANQPFSFTPDDPQRISSLLVSCRNMHIQKKGLNKWEADQAELQRLLKLENAEPEILPYDGVYVSMYARDSFHLL